MKSEFKKLLESYEKSALDDTIGLYEIIGGIKRTFKTNNAKKLQDLTLEFIKVMLASGFQVGNSEYSATGYRAWKNQDAAYVTDRIKTEWNALGKIPNIGDIAYFDLKAA